MKKAITALFDGQGRRVSYRRFVCFITATFALFIGGGELLTADTWALIAAAYIGGDSLEAMMAKWKGTA
tara:strand:+ start:473 stop:679 length:207 start_codon:yes stop_codon:yes gene_type:complete